jgi:hypothetical protein
MDRRGSDAVRCELAILGRSFTLCRRAGPRLADFGRGAGISAGFLAARSIFTRRDRFKSVPRSADTVS